MYEVFSSEKTYTLPNGAQKTGSEMISSGEYPILSNPEAVVDVSGGILKSVNLISELKEAYGIEDLDISVAVINVNNAKMLRTRTENQKLIESPSVVLAAKIIATGFTDAQALMVPDLYDEYAVGVEYKKDDRFTYNGVLFKVNQQHTSQAQWVPGETGTESLYTKIVLNSSGYNVWQQPTGAHDAYNTGDIVEYKGTLYKSLIDGNVWAPDAYPQGWEVYTEE